MGSGGGKFRPLDESWSLSEVTAISLESVGTRCLMHGYVDCVYCLRSALRWALGNLAAAVAGRKP